MAAASPVMPPLASGVMAEPVFFVVERRAGREEAAIYYDQLPVRLTRKVAKEESPPIVYALRLDRLPDLAAAWLTTPIAQLYRNYCALRDAGKLPPSNLADPPRAKGEQGVKRGDYWTPPARTWAGRPADRLGAVGFVMVDGVLISERDAPPLDPRPPSLPGNQRQAPSGAGNQQQGEDDGRGIFLHLGGKP